MLLTEGTKTFITLTWDLSPYLRTRDREGKLHKAQRSGDAEIERVCVYLTRK